MRLLAERLSEVQSALDIDTGGGEVVAEAPVLPSRMVVTEGWPPNAERARMLLGPRGVDVVKVKAGYRLLPFPDQSFELVTSRHPVRPDWDEIRRVLMPGGHYPARGTGVSLRAHRVLPRAACRRTRRPPPGSRGCGGRAGGPCRGVVATGAVPDGLLRRGGHCVDLAQVRLVGTGLLRRQVRRQAASARRAAA
jgi:SAM-dependent methyltransferase